MTILNSSSRLKVKRDTFFLPDPKGGVYFRNNLSSFQMEGSTIYQWIEKLLPLFNGEQTLGDLTEGLTAPYQNRVYELAETLVKNGFVRDLSRDQPHQLNTTVLERYASQIEFIENFTESGAYRFQQYRQAKALVIGSGFLIVSMVSSLLESGLPKFDVMVTDSMTTNRERMHELIQNARIADTEVEVEEVPIQKKEKSTFWREAIQPYDCILYVSQDGNVEELRELNQVCKEERKAFIPAICLELVGLAGPLIHPEADGCFESAWRRIHQTALQGEKQQQNFSTTAGSILANIAVFELFKKVTGVSGSNQSNQIYFLNLESLEGEWLSFITHPLITMTDISPKLVDDLDGLLDQNIKRNEHPPYLMDYFSQLTSEEIGIFHTWEERNLTQLPLAQCYVQAVDPLSDGPAELLSEVVRAGFTHQEAQREAGLTGIELYASRWIDSAAKKPDGLLGIGAGETVEEAVCRGLEAYLDKSLRNRRAESGSMSYSVKMGRIEDRRSRFYFHALTTLHGVPAIGKEEDLLGFPVIWIRSKGRLYTKAGLNATLALRSALKQALIDAQNQVNSSERQTAEAAVFLKMNDSKLEIPSCEENSYLELLQSSIQILSQTNKRLFVYDLAVEPFLKQELAGVFGVQLREGET
jgi:putative thiazole-containing bacteriocin maturation protein